MLRLVRLRGETPNASGSRLALTAFTRDETRNDAATLRPRGPTHQSRRLRGRGGIRAGDVTTRRAEPALPSGGAATDTNADPNPRASYALAATTLTSFFPAKTCTLTKTTKTTR